MNWQQKYIQYKITPCCFCVKLPAASHHPQDMFPNCKAMEAGSQAEANVKAGMVQKKQVMVYSHADGFSNNNNNNAFMQRAFLMKPNVF